MSSAGDRARLRRSATRVGVMVGVASAIVIASGVLILVAVLVLTARSEMPHDGGHEGADGDRVVVDLDRVLPWVILLGVTGVVLLGVVAWMAARWAVRPLADALRLQRAFVSDASHELRTPLTALTSRVQMLERRHRRGEPLDATIASLREDASVLDDVLADMLLTAEGAVAVGERARVADSVSAAVATLRPLADESGVRITVDTAPTACAAIPPITLTRLCMAVLDNAIQHAPKGTTVAVTTRHVGPVVEIRIADAGSGIAVEDRQRIFERFARGSEAGRRRGFGLGLALVREAAARHGGTFGIEDTSAAGTTFLLSLPAC